MGKLWDKGFAIDTLIESFTVGNDFQLDQHLVLADCMASIAHARTLHKARIISDEDKNTLEQAFKEIISLTKDNQFVITLQDEDCHTAIETYITRTKGEVGKRIHTGRSRNDQVQTALRLWMREFVLKAALNTLDLSDTLLDFASKHQWVPMTGRTHMQLAMPSSVGLWASSFAEQLIDEARHLGSLFEILDQSPLGSAASYGTSLPLDREFSAIQMGFSKVQNNVLYANNSRGKFEAMLLDACDYICLTLSKIAQDLLLFTLPEFGYFTLPKELCTGSSIMPQKQNPDGLELVRSRSAVVTSCSERVKAIIRSLPSGYNRDFQDTKDPLITGCRTTIHMVAIMDLTFSRLEVHSDRLEQGCRNELYATDEVFRLISNQVPFREAYRQVARQLEQVQHYDAIDMIKNRTSAGTTGNLGLENTKSIGKELSSALSDRLESCKKAYRHLCGMPMELVSI